MKKIFVSMLFLLLLTGCGSRVDLMPKASPETSALELTIYDGETLTRQYLFGSTQVRADAIAPFRNASARKADVDLTSLQPPFYGLAMGGTDGWEVKGLWADGYFIMGNGSVYSFDYDFETMLETCKFDEPEEFQNLALMPCITHVAKTESGWNKACLSLSKEPAGQSGVTMTLAEQTDTHLVVEISNGMSEEFGYGHAFGLDVYLDGQWYDVPSEGTMAFTEELMIVASGAVAQERCWIEPYGNLPAGDYRLVLQDMAVEFTME